MGFRRTHLSVATSLALVASLVLVAPVALVSAAHGTFTTSDGIYRIPFADGITVTANNDHHNHPNEFNRVDLGSPADSTIVAAASGIIRGLVDNNGESGGNGDGVDINGNPQDDSMEHSCLDDTQVVGDCSDYNNYVWIEHPNGEWTKYTHFATQSVTDNGWFVGAPILAGEALGTQSDVGSADGPHLHFEVAVPTDPNDDSPFSDLGGFVPGAWNVVTRVCFTDGDDDGDGLYTDGESYTAGPCVHVAPTADAGGPYEVDEGSSIQLDGTGSFDPEGLPLTFLWEPDTYLDDPGLAQPTYSGVDDLVDPLMLTVYDTVEAIADSDTTVVTVLNVPPDVTAVGDSIDEGGTATVTATFEDPGTLDTHTATIDWDDGTGPHPVTVAQLAAGIDHTYGDDGLYEVLVTVTDDDGGSGDDIAEVDVANIDPAVTLGEAVYIAHAGETVDVTAETTDPGSDDLFATWTWGDGLVDDDESLVNPPAHDQPKSPTVQPRDVDWVAEHIYADACLYELELEVVDDDGGSGSDTAAVVITGNDDQVWGSGWWMNQYRPKPPNWFTTATLVCYLDIVRFMSGVFDEARAPLDIRADAVDVLFVNGNGGSAIDLFDEQLLAAWLNFANGGYDLDSPVDTTGDGIADVSFANAVAAAEAVRLNAASSRAEILAQKDILELIVTSPPN
jgi:murein DD-endopeptidase MepM/ murein hydrolase activator NlpD